MIARILLFVADKAGRAYLRQTGGVELAIYNPYNPDLRPWLAGQGSR